MIIKSITPAKGMGAFILLCTLSFFSGHAMAAPGISCTLTPMRSTNNVGSLHSVTLQVTTNGTGAGGVSVDFDVISGPNAGLSQTSTTSGSGSTIFSYTSNGTEGTDIIRASGTINGTNFSCLATQRWVAVSTAPTVQCPGNIVTNAAGDNCARSVTFSVVGSGSPMPTVRCRIGDTAVTSPHSFPAGVSTVTCTASNVNGVGSCSFTVTVNETEPPQITCGDDVFVSSVPGDNGALVEFDLPSATDNCGAATVVCVPASGTVFPVGTTLVECTATDTSGNTNLCAFNVNVEEMQAEAHDMAVVRIRAPRTVTLTETRPFITKRIVVTVQNRSAHTETFFDQAQLDNLVTLTMHSFNTDVCADVTLSPLSGPPQRRLPFNLRPRQKLNIYLVVTFDCSVNPARGLGSEDFFYTATVDHTQIDGNADTHPECDVCPRPPLDGLFDPNPNGRIRDRGCGAPTGGGNFGGEVLTDIISR
jgi:hypothetical protein